MSRPCRWCGVFYLDPDELYVHENGHRDPDALPRIFNGLLHETQERTHETRDTFQCQVCHKTYANRKNLKRHTISVHGESMFQCSRCRKVFNRLDNKKTHEVTCVGNEHVCSMCQKRCSSAYGLRCHIQWHDKAPKVRPERKIPAAVPKKMKTKTSPTVQRRFHCKLCSEIFNNRRELYLHRMKTHFQTGGSLHPRPWGDDSEPWVGDDDTVDQDLRDVYEANEPLILEQHRLGPIQSVYNFPIGNDVNIDQLMNYAGEIYNGQQRAFRLNITFGVILQNRETEHYRYFVPYTNNGIFESPVSISKKGDLNGLRLRLSKIDINNELLRIRSDTKWIPVLLTNVHFNVYNTHYPVGQGDLPDYLLNKVSMFPLVKNRHTGRVYKDDLCMFRCLALHRGHDIKSVDGPAREYVQQWHDHSKNEKQFCGVAYEEFPDFENFFKVNLEVYKLRQDGFASSIYKSRGRQESTMYVNMHENHVSYIKEFALYASKYRCNTCDRHFEHSRNLHRHERVCANKTKYVYPGGFHRASECVFEQLDQYGINVPKDEQHFDWFICYDFESILRKVNVRPTEFLQWTQRHEAISVSICSNVEGYTDPFCIVEEDLDKLVKNMVASMNEIAEHTRELAEIKWGWVLEAIEEHLRRDIDAENSRIEQDEEEENDKEEKKEKKEKKLNHPLNTLYARFESYMSQVPVLGFNSAKYDLNLVKQVLAKNLNMHDSKDTFVVKNNNDYTCIGTERLKLMDISRFLAAGSSYDSFLKAYHVEENKGFFPYEWFDDPAKLEETSLPPHVAFYSSLKRANITVENYQYCQNVWRENQMTHFRDFLVWYNNLDVAPFVKAVERFQKFFFDKDVDVFKTAISVPGIARQLLFRTAVKENVNFALFDKYNADLYQTVKNNIVGGPSIIFNRQHCVGKTKIRGDKQCGAILGFDANALYLQCIGLKMPIGPFVRRRVENNFRPELRDKYMSAYYWMDWLMHIDGVRIEHKLNCGREVRIGKYPVDGYSHAQQTGDNPTVYQFHGCYWHGHICDVTRNVKNDKWKASRKDKFQNTLETTMYIKERGCNVIEIWECEFLTYCRRNPGIYAFIDSTRPGFFQHHKREINESHILSGVVDGLLFGMVEVDIEVPQSWPEYFEHPTLTPYQYFEEMSPLFCNTDVSFEDIGEHMQEHVVRHNLSTAPRRLLVGGMRGKQLLLSTPLLEWYLKHGLVVTNIYQVVEYKEQRCFKTFVEDVSEARRMGDSDPDTAIIADTMKVIGNSGYGSLIMDKTKHRDIKYVQGETETCLKVNEPRFRKLDCLDQEEEYYEVEMAKRKIKLDLPIQLGYFILQYAKLRMLEFYFDFMDKYVDRRDFEYCEMDTDSAYMAITGECLADVIKPVMKSKYEHGLNGFCTDDDVQADAFDHWFPRTCCTKHSKYDKRTPGLFKLEYQGHEIIGLCSKTYIVRKTKTTKPSSARIAAYKLLRRSLNKKKAKRCPYKLRLIHDYKFSSKGVSKRTVIAPMTKFRHVIKTGIPQSANNRGFRVRKNTIFTYTQERRGFSYFYCKRKVADDGIRTTPLDITLCPVPKQEVVDQELMLVNNTE